MYCLQRCLAGLPTLDPSGRKKKMQIASLSSVPSQGSAQLCALPRKCLNHRDKVIGSGWGRGLGEGVHVISS